MSTHVQYQEGSLKELWKTSFPLMMSWLSVMMMGFIDRLYLANYSLDALNSAVKAGTMAWAFIYALEILCEMSEVFVAQYNGAKQYKKLGRPVWQMLWVSLVSFAFFIPFGYWGREILFPTSPTIGMEGDYFGTLMYFAPAYGLIGACTAFFIGQGRTALITGVVVVANIINLVLDPLFIFGWEGYVPEMGIKGAAIATGIGSLAQGLILFAFFIRRKNRETLGAADYHFDRQLLRKCLRVGAPVALCMTLELLGWGFFYNIMSLASPTHILVAGLCQSILILFFFFGIGMEKGITAIAGNLIGAKLHHKIPNLMSSARTLIGIFTLLTAIPFVLYPDLFLDWFLNNKQTLEMGHGPAVAGDIAGIRPILYAGLVITWFYLLTENTRMAYNAPLMAAGDTLFIMGTNVTLVWFCLLVPTYLWVISYGADPLESLYVWTFYGVIACAAPMLRYWYGSWKERTLIEA